MQTYFVDRKLKSNIAVCSSFGNYFKFLINTWTNLDQKTLFQILFEKYFEYAMTIELFLILR